MEIVKIRVRPKNGDRRLRTLLFSSDTCVNGVLVRQKLSELFPLGFWLDEDKIERFIVDFSISEGKLIDLCDHKYLEVYKTAPIKYYTKKEVENLGKVRSALDAT